MPPIDPLPDEALQADQARTLIRDLDAAALKVLIAFGTVLVDVRREEEFKVGHIPGSLRVGQGSLLLKAAALFPRRDLSIALVCSNGDRSTLSALALQNLGHSAVVVLRGGLAHWPDSLQSAATEIGADVAGNTSGGLGGDPL